MGLEAGQPLMAGRCNTASLVETLLMPMSAPVGGGNEPGLVVNVSLNRR